MKRFIIDFVLLFSFLGSFCFAQTDQSTIKEDFKPSTLNQPHQEYPQVNSQGYARFRIVAPQAQSVIVGLGGRGGTNLTRAADSSWMGTTAGPLDKGFHYYHLRIDGGIFNDPGTLNFYGSGKAVSKFLLRTRTSTPSKMFLTVKYSRFFFTPRVQTPHVGRLSILHPVTIMISQSAILCCICSMVGAKMKPPGQTRVTPI